MVTRYTVVQDGQVYEPGDDVPDMGSITALEIKPTGTKYIKMCWQSDLTNPLAITTPTVYFR